MQVGDPFTEKLLMEASLELIASGHIVAIQDMGAAGLTSSSAEMAARGGVGVEIDLSLVPTREPGMTPYEILLSESQERMLVVAKPDRVAQVQAIAAKWELDATPIGRVTDDGMYRGRWKDHVVVEIPGRPLVEGSEPLTLLPLARGVDLAPLRAALAGDGTVVVYKGGRHLAEIAAVVKESGRTAVYGAHVGLPDQDVRELSEVDGPAPYLATVLVPAVRRTRGGKL